MEHIISGHFNRALGNSRSIFSISIDKLKILVLVGQHKSKLETNYWDIMEYYVIKQII